MMRRNSLKGHQDNKEAMEQDLSTFLGWDRTRGVYNEFVPSRKYMGIKIPVMAGRDLYIAQDVYIGCTFASGAFVLSLPSSRLFLSNLGLSRPQKGPDIVATSRLCP